MSTNLETVLNTIQADKNNNCKPENIRYGTELLGVKGTLKPVTLNGGDTATCIYLQDETPTDKNGIWINTDKICDQISIENELYTNQYTVVSKVQGQVDSTNLINKITLPSTFGGSTYCQKGNIMHIFGRYAYNTSTSVGNVDENLKIQHYSYDFEKNEWTKLSDCPTPQGGGGAVWIDNYIYIFGTVYKDYVMYAYKYNVIDDTWERLADITLENSPLFSSSSDYVYFLDCCHNNMSNPNLIYLRKSNTVLIYNIETNTYEKYSSFMQNVRTSYYKETTYNYRVLFAFYNNMIIFLSTHDNYDPSGIYLDGYDVVQDKYINIKYFSFNKFFNYDTLNSKADFSYGGGLYDTFVVGSKQNDYVKSLYDLTSFTAGYFRSTVHGGGDSLTLSSYYPCGIFKDNGVKNIICFGTSSYSYANECSGLVLDNKDLVYDKNTVVLYINNGSTGKYKTELFKNDKIINGKSYIWFDDVNIYDATDGKLLRNLPTYYGNGTDWVKIK